MDYTYHMSNKDIRNTIIKLNKDITIMTEEEINDKYKDFKEKYSIIFKLITEETLTTENATKIEKILKGRSLIKTKDDHFKQSVRYAHANTAEHFPKEHQPTMKEYERALKKIENGESSGIEYVQK